MGALGTIPSALEVDLEEAGVDIEIDLLQKSIHLGTAAIVRKVLES